MNAFEVLRTIILETVDEAGDSAHHLGEPSKSQVFELSRLWNKIAGTYFDEVIHLGGWKSDWVRGAKHTFIESCVTLAYPDQRLSKSTDVPREVYGLIIEYVDQHPVAVKSWIVLHEREILERADLLTIEGFNHHLNREPVMSAEDLPNLQGPTPAYPQAEPIIATTKKEIAHFIDLVDKIDAIEANRDIFDL